MADAYSGWAKNGAYDCWRTHCAAWIVSETSTQVRIRCECRWQSSNIPDAASGWVHAWAHIDGQQVGYTDHSASYTIGNGSEATIVSGEITINKGASARDVNCSARIYFDAAYTPSLRADLTASLNIHIASGIQKPDAPKNVSFVRVNDSNIKLSWQSTATSIKPWSTVYASKRWGKDGADWAVGWEPKSIGNVTSYTYNDCKPNCKYVFAVYATNSVGESSHVNSGIIYTTPSKPPSFKVSLSNKKDLSFEISTANTYAYKVQLQEQHNGGEWKDIAKPSVSNSIARCSYVADYGVSKFRARIVRPTYDDNESKEILYSEWVETDLLPIRYYPFAIMLSGKYMSCNRSGGSVYARSTNAYDKQVMCTGPGTESYDFNTAFVKHSSGWKAAERIETE